MSFLAFFFKLVNWMDYICIIQLLYYEPMMWLLCSKPSFCSNKQFLCSCEIVWILTERIFVRDCVFLNNYIDVTFTWITCAWYMTNDNEVMYLILTSQYLGPVNILLRFQIYFFILYFLDCSVTDCCNCIAKGDAT